MDGRKFFATYFLPVNVSEIQRKPLLEGSGYAVVILAQNVCGRKRFCETSERLTGFEMQKSRHLLACDKY
jgi:hypothetical protein